MAKTNQYLVVIAARISERAQLYHEASLLHLEASRQAYACNLRGEHHAGVSVGYSREAQKLDAELLKIIRQNPSLKISPSNDLGILIRNSNTTNTTQSNPPNPQLTASHNDIDPTDILKSVELVF